MTSPSSQAVRRRFTLPKSGVCWHTTRNHACFLRHDPVHEYSSFGALLVLCQHGRGPSSCGPLARRIRISVAPCPQRHSASGLDEPSSPLPRTLRALSSTFATRGCRSPRAISSAFAKHRRADGQPRPNFDAFRPAVEWEVLRPVSLCLACLSDCVIERSSPWIVQCSDRSVRWSVS